MAQRVRVQNDDGTQGLVVLGTGSTTVVHTATITSGGVTAGDVFPIGTTIDDLITKAYAPYVSSSFASFAVGFTGGSSPWEVGQVINVSSATFTITNDSDGQTITNKTITGTGFNSGTVISSSPVSPSAATLLDTATTGTRTWTINGLNSHGGAVSRSATGSVFHSVAFGASSTIASDNASAQTVYGACTKTRQGTKAMNVTCTAANANPSNFTYIIIPVSYGLLTNIIQNGSLPVLGAFSYGTYTITNASGASVSCYVYKSNAMGAFANGVTLAIT